VLNANRLKSLRYRRNIPASAMLKHRGLPSATRSQSKGAAKNLKPTLKVKEIQIVMTAAATRF
jgi:hypothetical protein